MQILGDKYELQA